MSATFCAQSGRSWQLGPRNSHVVNTLCGRTEVPQVETVRHIHSEGIFAGRPCPHCLAADAETTS